MDLFRLLLISAVCLMLVIPANAWGRRRRWRRWRVGRTIVRIATRFAKRYAIRAAMGGLLRNCNTKYALGCTVGEDALAEERESCQLKTSGCKREMSEEEYLRDVSLADVPFDGDFDDYDEDGDGFIEEQEFFNTVLAAVPMKDPDELSIPFDASDIDEDGKISREEFGIAPLLFGDAEVDDDDDDVPKNEGDIDNS